MNPISLTLGFNPAPNTKSLIDGSVRPKGIELRVQTKFSEGFDNVGARHRKIIPPPCTREHAIELLEKGELDAALEPYQTLSSNPRLRLIFPDYRKVEEEFFLRTGAFPINHLLVLREHIAEAHPWIVESLLTAFREAEALAERYRNEEEKKEAAWERKVMGELFAYSLKKGPARRSLATLMEYQIQQGILDSKPEIESLFFPQALDI